jgi:hypothetical protein
MKWAHKVAVDEDSINVLPAIPMDRIELNVQMEVLDTPNTTPEAQSTADKKKSSGGLADSRNTYQIQHHLHSQSQLRMGKLTIS